MPVLFPSLIPARCCKAGVTLPRKERKPPPRFWPWGAPRFTGRLSWLPPALVPSALSPASSCHALKEMPDACRGEHSLSLPLSYSKVAEHPGRIRFLRASPSHSPVKCCPTFLLAKAVRKTHPEQATGCRSGQCPFNTPDVEPCHLQRFNLAWPHVPSTPVRFHCLRSVQSLRENESLRLEVMELVSSDGCPKLGL